MHTYIQCNAMQTNVHRVGTDKRKSLGFSIQLASTPTHKAVCHSARPAGACVHVPSIYLMTTISAEGSSAQVWCSASLVDWYCLSRA